MRVEKSPEPKVLEVGSFLGQNAILALHDVEASPHCGDPAEPFFEGMSLDDLLRPIHLNAKFFGMTPLPTFGAFDVMKNPDVANDLARFDAHLATTFGELINDAA